MDNILEKVLEQHRSLKNILLLTEKQLDSSSNSQRILDLLNKFVDELKAHLKLENSVFYPELLKRMVAKGLNTKKTEKFIAEMKDIEKVLYVFFDKNKSVKNIQKDFELFKKKFLSIKEDIFLRVDSEEDGVFLYY